MSCVGGGTGNGFGGGSDPQGAGGGGAQPWSVLMIPCTTSVGIDSPGIQHLNMIWSPNAKRVIGSSLAMLRSRGQHAAVGLLLLLAATFPEEAIVPAALLEALVPAARQSVARQLYRR